MSAVVVYSTVTGLPGAAAVVLSNSLGSTHRMWGSQLAALEERFRVIRYDTRGHGASPVPDGPYSIDDLADDLVALLDREELERAHLVGLSLGGMTAMRVASRYPQRVARLALLCTGVQMPPASRWAERAATVRAKGAGEIARAVVERWFTPDWLAANQARAMAYEAMVAATPAEGYAACCEAIAALDLRGDLPLISSPTLVVAGADDPVAPPAMLKEIADGVQQADYLVVPRAAHLANVEQPRMVTEALVKHLERA